jgi:hypothetical protein
MGSEKLPFEAQPTPKPNPEDDLPAKAGPVSALAGMVLVVLGMAVLIASLILRDGNLTGEMPTFPFAGLLARVVGTLVMVVGMVLLGKSGMVKFGLVLLVGGAVAYLGNVIINHRFDGAANGLGGLAALLGLILLAVANGWLGREQT